MQTEKRQGWRNEILLYLYFLWFHFICWLQLWVHQTDGVFKYSLTSVRFKRSGQTVNNTSQKMAAHICTGKSVHMCFVFVFLFLFSYVLPQCLCIFILIRTYEYACMCVCVCIPSLCLCSIYMIICRNHMCASLYISKLTSIYTYERIYISEVRVLIRKLKYTTWGFIKQKKF